MFFIKETYACNFADDTTTYSFLLSYEEPHRKLSNDANIVLNLLSINNMVANPENFR